MICIFAWKKKLIAAPLPPFPHVDELLKKSLRSSLASAGEVAELDSRWLRCKLFLELPAVLSDIYFFVLISSPQFDEIL